MNVDIDNEDSCLNRKRASSWTQRLNVKKYKESQYDILADWVRKSLNMEKIYEIVGIKRWYLKGVQYG